MTIDFMTIDIVLVDEQPFVWVFTKFPFHELLHWLKDFVVWKLFMSNKWL